MTDSQKGAGRWQVAGWILLALGLVDLLAWHAHGSMPFLDTLHLGSRDRAWALVVLGGIGLATAAILRQIGRLGENPSRSAE